MKSVPLSKTELLIIPASLHPIQYIVIAFSAVFEKKLARNLGAMIDGQLSFTFSKIRKISLYLTQYAMQLLIGHGFFLSGSPYFLPSRSPSMQCNPYRFSTLWYMSSV